MRNHIKQRLRGREGVGRRKKIARDNHVHRDQRRTHRRALPVRLAARPESDTVSIRHDHQFISEIPEDQRFPKTSRK